MSGTPTPRDGRDSNVLSVGDVELALSPSGDDPPGRTNQQRALSHVRSGVRSPSSSSGRFTPPRRASGFRELSQGLGSPTSSVYRGNDLAGIFASCRDATMELELAVRAAVSHREKCAVVLGAAVAVNIALAEADAVSPALDAVTQMQLKRLCSGVLSTLGLAVARVRVYGQFSRIRKIFRLIRYRATESKFEELRSDLETLEAQLWNLTGAVGGLGLGGTVAPGPGVDGMTRKGNRGGTRKASVMPDRPRRMLRGGATHWILGGNVRVMCAAGVDGSELWWSSNRSASLSAYDLFLDTHRNIAGISTEPTRTTDADGNDVPNLTGTDKSRCLGICLGDVTAMAAEEASALLWTGTEWGGVATWDTDLGTQWGVVSVLSPKRSAVTAIAAVAGRAAWVALADGSIHEVAVPENHEDESRSSRVLCAAGERPTLGVSQTDDSMEIDIASAAAKEDIPNRPEVVPKKAELLGWGSISQGRRRHAGARVREMLRLGALVWCSSDDGVLEAWDVVTGACAVVAPHRDLGACVALVPHPAAGQLVTVHATGAVQLWQATGATEDASESEDASENESSLGMSRRHREDTVLGHRVQRLAGPQPAGGKVVGAAAVDRLLCIGHESGMLKIMVLPGGSGGSAESQVSGLTTPSGRSMGFSAVPVVAKIRAHRSGMVLLRSVDGGGHVGVCTAGKFGSMMFWPLAELEAAVAAAQPPRAPRAGVSTGRAPRRDSFSQLQRISGDDSGSVRDDSINGSIPPTPASLGKSANLSQASSLGQSTALIPFKDIRLKKCIGEGSFGRVYLALWSNHTEVAVKILGPPSSFAGKEDPLAKQMGGKRRGLEVGANAARGIAGASPPRNQHNRHPHAEDSLSSSDDDEAEQEGEDAAAAEVLDELEKEVAIMARLRHPNIVLLLGAVRSPPSIVEEFCARGSLFSVLQRHTKPGVPPLEWRVRLQMALGAAAGMCYLHNCSPPIIHRDLKSPNLMVDRYFRVKVGDFNLSRVAVASVRDSKGTGGHSAAYSTGGLHSPRWMAPEVLQNATYSRASDVYSFAVVMWELRSLQVPWAQYGQWQVMTAVVEEGQRPPLDEVPTPSFEHLTIYDELMEDGWSQEPGDRPAFEEIIARLQGLIDMHAKGVAVSKSKEQAAVGAGGKPEVERKHRRTISFGSLRMSSEKAIRQSADKATEEVKAGSQPGSPTRMSAAEDESAADKVMTRILSRKASQKLKSLPQNVRASAEAAKDSLRLSTDSLGPAMAAAVAEQEAAERASPAPTADEPEPTTPRDIEVSVESADESEAKSPALSPAMSRGASLRRLQKWVNSSGINSPPTKRGGTDGDASFAEVQPEAGFVPPMTSPRRPPPHSRSRSDLVTPGKPPLGASGGNVATSNPMLRAMAARKNMRESYPPPPGSPQVVMHRRSHTVDWNTKHDERSGDGDEEKPGWKRLVAQIEMRTPTRAASRRPFGRLQILPWVIAVSALAWSLSMRLEMASYNHELVARQVAIVEGRATTPRGHPSAGHDCEPCPRCVQGSMASELKAIDATPDPRAVTFVLVATMNANNGPRVAALLASVQKYVEKDRSAVHTLLAVVPDAELRWWELAASALGDQPAFKIGVLAESAALRSGVEALKRAAPKTGRRETRGLGYRFQMLLKLGVAEHVPTDFYVTFDCDVVLARPLHLGDLVRKDENGALKGVTQGSMGGPHAHRWLSSSLDSFFGTTPGSAQQKGGVNGAHDCRVSNLMHTVGVTPAVMSKHGAIATLKRLEQRAEEEGKRGWDEYLFSALEDGLDWTEYGLYAAGTCLDGSFNRHHVVDPKVRLYDAALQEDGSKFMDPKVMNEAFGPNPFVVVQSIGGSDATSVADALYSHLGNSAVEATR